MESASKLSESLRLGHVSQGELELVAECVSDEGGLRAIRQDWDRLWRLQSRREIFTTYGWCWSAWASHEPRRMLNIVVVRRATTVVGLLPLVRTSSGLAFMGSPWSDYNDMLVADSEPCTIVKLALVHAFNGTPGQVGDLAEIPEWSNLSECLPTLPEDLRARICIEQGADCPALRLSLDRDVLLREAIGKKSLKRHEKKLERIGTVTLRHIDSRESAHQTLPDFFEQHIARRAVAGGRSLFLDATARRFYGTLIDNFDPTVELRFSVLEASGRAVAYHFGFEVDGRFTWYKPSFDVDLAQVGVGEVLIKRLLEYIRPRTVHEFDFTRGSESFKDRFANHRGRNTHWRVHRSVLSASVARTRLRLLESAKGSPWIRSLRDRWKSHTSSERLPSHREFVPSDVLAIQIPARDACCGERYAASVLGVRDLALEYARSSGQESEWFKAAMNAALGGATCLLVTASGERRSMLLCSPFSTGDVNASTADGLSSVPVFTNLKDARWVCLFLGYPGLRADADDLRFAWIAAERHLPTITRGGLTLAINRTEASATAVAIEAGFVQSGEHQP